MIPKAVRWRAEYLGARLVQGAALCLPASALVFLSWCLGNLMYRLLKKRVAVGRENMARSLPDVDPRQMEALLKRSFQHFSLVPLELLHLGRALRKRSPAEILRIDGEEKLQALREAGTGAVFVTGHIGNWEVMGALGPKVGFPLLSVGRGVDNPYLHRMLLHLRTRFGQRIADKDGALRFVARELRKGAFVAMLLDQHAGRRGLRVPFLGRPASTFPSAAVMARRFGVPMVPTVSYRDGETLRFRVEIGEILHPDPELSDEEDAYRMTRAYTRTLEQAIRRHPGQWLWFHRRWRQGGTEPEPEWAARYA